MSDEHQPLIEAARDFARGTLMALDRRYDRDETPITSVLPQLSEMGFMNLYLSEDYGGLGCSYRTYAAILHELAYASPSTSVTVAVHNMVGTVLEKIANADQRLKWLTRWGSPEYFAAFAITEAGAGSDAGASRTTAVHNGSNYILNGEKMWITNGLTCRWFLTLAKLPNHDAARPLAMLMVDGRQEGVKRTPIHGKMGIRASETAVIHFQDALAPMDSRVGEEGQGLSVARAALDCGRVGIAAQATGIAEACLDEMIAYARQREQFGQVIGSFQAVQNMIADSMLELTASKALIDRAATLIDENRPSSAAASMAKLYATEAANRIAYRAVQVHGGTGYVNECRVEQLFRDARITTIYEGTSEIQRRVIGRDLMAMAE